MEHYLWKLKMMKTIRSLMYSKHYIDLPECVWVPWGVLLVDCQIFTLNSTRGATIVIEMHLKGNMLYFKRDSTNC